MRRRLQAAVLAAVLAVPAAAGAQAPPPFPFDRTTHPGAAITPFIGYLGAFTRSEEWRFTSGESVFLVNSRVEIGSGIAGGAALDIPIAPTVGVSLVGTYASRRDARVTVEETEDVFSIDGHDIFMGQLLLGYYLPAQREQFVSRRIILSLHAGPVLVHERPRRKLAPADALPEATHIGGSIGAALHVPITDRLGLRLAAEDNIIRWNESALRDLAFVYFGRPQDPAGVTTSRAKVSHAWQLRAGLGLRLF